MRSAMCPSCGANVIIKKDNREFCFCEYCGAKILLDDYRSTHRVVDEAKLKQIESEHIFRMRELELEEKSRQKFETLTNILIKIWMVITLLVIVGAVISGLVGDGVMDAAVVLFYIGGPVVGGGAYLIFKVLPERELNKAISKRGGIKFPKSLEPFTEQHFETAVTILKNAGLTDVSSVNLHDVKIGLFQKVGNVESVVIDGKSIQSGGKTYFPSTKIIIKYHGK